MKSYEVIQKAVDEPGVKAVAAALKVSQALVYKWCEPPADSEDPEQSGAKNPLDRVREMYALTKDIRLVRWLCNEAGGFFVSNPDPALRKSFDEAIFGETRGMVREFSELLDTITESAETAPGIVPDEADEIREKWEDLKACVERFVIACEKGVYHPVKKKYSRPGMRDPDDLFAALEKSDFRRRFKLSARELAYARERGLDGVLEHAREFVKERLAPASPANDGKQTPMRNHPVFVAQHATATCCRGCLEKWHRIPRGRELTAAEQAHVLDAIGRWLRGQGVGEPEQGRLF